MISSEYFFTVYAIFVGILVLFKVADPAPIRPESKKSSMTKVWLVGILLILYFGFRPIDNMADTTVYAENYYRIQKGLLPPFYSMGSVHGIDLNSEIGFYFIRNILAVSGTELYVWFTIVAIIYIMPIIFAVHKLFHGYEYLAMLFFVVGFGFYSGGMNGIRNADACSLFFLGFTFLINKQTNRTLIGLLLLLLSYYFHHSIVILVSAVVFALFFVKNTRIAVAIWTGMIVVSLIAGNKLADFAISLNIDDRASNYLHKGANLSFMNKAFSYTGFRWDFLLYSSIPIFIGWYVTVKKKIKDKTYQLLLNTYILANAIWIVFMYAAYTNRYAALSWSLYPFVMLYPFIKYKTLWKGKQKLFISLFLIGQFIFDILFIQ